MPALVLKNSMALAGLAAHLSEIGSTAELELQNKRTVCNLVDIFTLVASGDGGGVTLALALLHGGRPKGL